MLYSIFTHMAINGEDILHAKNLALVGHSPFSLGFVRESAAATLWQAVAVMCAQKTTKKPPAPSSLLRGVEAAELQTVMYSLMELMEQKRTRKSLGAGPRAIHIKYARTCGTSRQTAWISKQFVALVVGNHHTEQERQAN